MAQTPGFNAPKPHETIDMEDLGPRYLILCFDGTGNKFGQENSNVVRLFHALKKDKPNRQLVYYQPGIGTYNKRQFITRSANYIAAAIDQAVALHLNDHVKGGYQYIMRNYRKGDKICLFGFSRGAYTARVLAGMLYKVGVLPPDNDEQVDFAFSVYQTQGDDGIELGKAFKKTFSATSVTVEFLGVWDTVSSVGIIPRSHPYTSVNYGVKTFRHALALDERRARFRPNLWTEPTLDREQDIDLDDPEVEFPPEKMEDREHWQYKAPDRDFCDVEEVWFAGCHADIGGGSHDNKVQDSLSYIPLRWMIKECMRNTEILFDLKLLASYGFEMRHLVDVYGLKSVVIDGEPKVVERLRRLGLTEGHIKKFRDTHDVDVNNLRLMTNEQLNVQTSTIPTISLSFPLTRRHLDVFAKKWDQLELVMPWWILEFIPMLTTHQNPNSQEGDWIRKRERNFGRGRYVPFSNYEVKVHQSVLDRIEGTTKEPKDEKTEKEPKYEPRAYNWGVLVESGMITWVDDEP